MINIHIYEKQLDGSYLEVGIIQRWVDTGEELTGIERTGVDVNVYREWTSTNLSETICVFDLKYTSVQVDEMTGLTDGEYWKKTAAWDYYSWKLAQKLSFGVYDIASGIGSDRIYETGEYKTWGYRISEIAGGVLDLITLGRSVGSKEVVKKLGKSGTKAIIDKLVDFGVESITKEILESLGLSGSQQLVFSYYLVKFMYKEMKAQTTKLVDLILKLAKTGTKGKDLVQMLRNELGVNLDMPLDKGGAIQEALNSYFQDTPLPPSNSGN